MANEPKKKPPAEEEPQKRKRKEPPAPKYAPNIIPLIDVLFMLLLYFLLSTRFRQMEGDIAGSLPGTQSSDKVAPDDLEITILPAGEGNTKARYEIARANLQMDSAEDLYAQLLRYTKEYNADTPVLIKPQGNVRWIFVVEAFNQSVRARFKNIGFVAN